MRARARVCVCVCVWFVSSQMHSVTRYNMFVPGTDLKLSSVGPTGTRTRGHYIIWKW